MVCTTCLKTCRTTKNLECQEIRKDQMNLKTSFYSPIPIVTPTIIFFFNTTKKLLKKKWKWTFHVVHSLTWKLEFASDILSMIERGWILTIIYDRYFSINFICSRCSYILATNQDLLLIALILVCNIFNETLFPVEFMRYKLYRYMRENIRNWNMKFFI